MMPHYYSLKLLSRLSHRKSSLFPKEGFIPIVYEEPNYCLLNTGPFTIRYIQMKIFREETTSDLDWFSCVSSILFELEFRDLGNSAQVWH